MALVIISNDSYYVFLTIFPVAGILAFQPPGLGSYSMRVTASYSYEGLVAAALVMLSLLDLQILNCAVDS